MSIRSKSDRATHFLNKCIFLDHFELIGLSISEYKILFLVNRNGHEKISKGIKSPDRILLFSNALGWSYEVRSKHL